jgi:hypothetical protein
MKKANRSISRKGVNSPIVDEDGDSTRYLQRAALARQQHRMQICRFPGFNFPDQLKCCLKYREFGISFSGSVTPAAQVYRLNSIFDPNLTGVGHRPAYLTQLSAIYTQYVVTAARLRCRIFNETTVETQAVLVYSDVNTSTQTVENLCEARWAKECFNGIQNSGKSVMLLDGGVLSIPMLMGEKNLNTDPSQYSAVTTNPVDVAFGIFKIASVDGITNMKAIVNFELEQDVTFKELTPVSES